MITSRSRMFSGKETPGLFDLKANGMISLFKAIYPLTNMHQPTFSTVPKAGTMCGLGILLSHESLSSQLRCSFFDLGFPGNNKNPGPERILLTSLEEKLRRLEL